MRGFIFRSWLDGLFQVYQRNIPLRQRQLLLLLLLLNFVEQRLLLLLLLTWQRFLIANLLALVRLDEAAFCTRYRV
jgi:hypothetical protein